MTHSCKQNHEVVLSNLTNPLL